MNPSSDSSDNTNGRGFTFAGLADLAPDGARILEVDAQLSGKLALLAGYGRALGFPGYFRHNWDSFEECLGDLSWIREPRVIIHHRQLPLAAAAQRTDQRIYLQILAQVVRTRPPAMAPQLTVSFAPGCARRTAALLRGT